MKKIATVIVLIFVFAGEQRVIGQEIKVPARLTPQSLSLPGIAQSDIDVVLAYDTKSNAARERMMQAQQMADGASKTQAIENARVEIKTVDLQVYPAVKRMVEAGYWTKVEPRSSELDNSVWLVVQHAAFDEQLQSTTLAQLEPLVKAEAFDGQKYAMLYDRVDLKKTGKQKFGSQMVCTAHSWVPAPLEDEKHVNELRRAYSFKKSLEEYQDMYKGETC